MSHFHYDRFDTPDDEQDGKWSVNFRTNPQGDVDEALMSLDEAAVVFTRKAQPIDPRLLADMPGSYRLPGGVKLKVVAGPSGSLTLIMPGDPELALIPVKGTQFRVRQFPDTLFEFVVEHDHVTALKQKDPSGEFSFPKQ
jgi:hypothetical protein